ncbi:MAG: GMC family oxidoreductase [Thermoanaerobaculia bacterium]
MPLTRRELLGGGAALALTGLYRCGRFAAGEVGGPYDVVVLGSGFAGTHLALVTAAAGLETALVEASPEKGLDFVSRGVGSPFEVANAGEIDYDANASRVIAVGGTSRHWTGMVNRLRPTDFRMASEFGLEVDWPLGYDDLAPWYCRAEEALAAVGGAVEPLAEPARECAYPRLDNDAYRPPQVEIDGERPAFFGVARSQRGDGPVRLAETEIPRFVSLPHAALIAGYQAVELVAGPDGGVEWVRLRDVEGNETRVRGRAVVVAAGVIETPRLLLRSRLGNGHDLVGRYFVEHPTLAMRFPPGPGVDVPPGHHRTYHYNDLFRRRGLNACHYQLHRLPGGDLEWKMQPELEGRPENRVGLSATEVDRYGTPRVELTFGYSERDRRTFDAGLEVLRREARALGAGAKAAVRRRWRDHPAGTCRMGSSPADGVVDRDHRVFGVDNLYLSGATVFPTSGTSNPTATVVAMTLRLASRLLERYSPSAG